jgi:hypothetical protein
MGPVGQVRVTDGAVASTEPESVPAVDTLAALSVEVPEAVNPPVVLKVCAPVVEVTPLPIEPSLNDGSPFDWKDTVTVSFHQSVAPSL